MSPAASFADLVGARMLIQCASLGGPISTPPLAAAISEAGGLGVIANPLSTAVQSAAEMLAALATEI